MSLVLPANVVTLRMTKQTAQSEEIDLLSMGFLVHAFDCAHFALFVDGPYSSNVLILSY